MGALRDELLAGVAGDVVEVGAGNGMNFSHYPATTTRVVAIEPEPHLRSLAEQAAARADVPVTVLAGRAGAVPLDSRSVDVGVVSLMLCALDDQSQALRELFRVIRPGGELRFLEHVAAAGRGLRLFQKLAVPPTPKNSRGGRYSSSYSSSSAYGSCSRPAAVTRVYLPRFAGVSPNWSIAVRTSRARFCSTCSSG